METKSYSIADLEHLSGFPRRTIHFYVREKMISPASSKGGPARYGEDHLLRLQMIRVLQGSHLRLDGIREALNGMDGAEMRRTIAEAEASKREWDAEAVGSWVGSRTDVSKDVLAQHSEHVGNMLAGLKRAVPQMESWQRMVVSDGIEVNLRSDLPEEIRQLLQKMLAEFTETLASGKRPEPSQKPESSPAPVVTTRPKTGRSRIDTSGLSGESGRGGLIDCHAARTVVDFFADVADYLPAGFSITTYGKNWFLQDEESSRVIDVRPKADMRHLDEAGIAPGSRLVARALPLWHEPAEGQIPEDQFRIDLSRIPSCENQEMFEYWDPATPLCDLLARIYYYIKGTVAPFTYGKQWILRDASSGRVFDVGTAWAHSMGVSTDTRGLGAVGITEGMNLEVVLLEATATSRGKRRQK